MQTKNALTVDDAARALGSLLSRYKPVIISTLVCGLAAHMYMLTNKLINMDETASLFSKGATITSGRWALEWSEFIFPNFSMPWLYGLLSILFITAALCLTVSIFEIKSPVMQALLGAAAVSSPVVTATMCYMFTSAPYCLAILLSVAAVYLVKRGGRLNYLLGCLCLCVSLGFYQAYMAVAASMFIVLLLQRLLCDRVSAAEVIRLGIRYFISLLVALALYGLVTAASLYFSGSSLIGYGYSDSGFFGALRNCYTNLVRTLYFGNAALIPNKASAAAHSVYLLCGIVCGISLLRGRRLPDVLLALLLLILLPISINCLYFAASVDVIHTIVKAGYVSVYVLCMVLAEAVTDRRAIVSWALSLSLLLVSAVNICYDNECYLKMQLQYENAFAFYADVAEDIRRFEGYDADCVLAPVGVLEDWMTPQYPQLYTYDNVGLSKDLINSYTRCSFLQYYIGLDLPMADWDTLYAFEADPRIGQMPCYPNDGYISRIDNYLVIKFG